MFDLALIDLAVFPGKRHLCPDVFCRMGMSCVHGCQCTVNGCYVVEADSLVMLRKRPFIGMHLSEIGSL